MDWSWAASSQNRGQRCPRFPKRRATRPKLMRLRRLPDEKPTSERAAEPLREALDVSIPTAIYEQAVREVRKHLGEQAFSQACGQGQGMSPQEALSTSMQEAAIQPPPEKAEQLPGPLPRSQTSSSSAIAPLPPI